MTAFKIFGNIIGIGLLMTLSCIFYGYALSLLWGWFIVPTFELPPLSLVPAIGLALVVSYLNYTNIRQEDETLKEVVFRILFFGIAKPVLAISFGWIIYQFM